MAHFAKLNESNVVTDVNVFDNAEINANGGDWSSEAETYVNNKICKLVGIDNKRSELIQGQYYSIGNEFTILTNPLFFIIYVFISGE